MLCWLYFSTLETKALPGVLTESSANSPAKIQGTAVKGLYGGPCPSYCCGQRHASALNQCPVSSMRRFPIPAARNRRPRQTLLCAWGFRSSLAAMQFPLGTGFPGEPYSPSTGAFTGNSWFDLRLLRKRTESLPDKCWCGLC